MTENQYQKLELRMRGICQRLEDIESKYGCKVKFKESVEDRLYRLESMAYATLVVDKPSECEHEWTRAESDAYAAGWWGAMAKVGKSGDCITISRRVAEECLRQKGLVLPNELHDEIKRGVER